MKLVLNRRTLQNALAAIRSVVPTRDISPILKNVLLRKTDRELQLEATDLEVGMEVAIPCGATPADSVLLPFDKLARMVAESVGDEFIIEIDGAIAKCGCGTA